MIQLAKALIETGAPIGRNLQTIINTLCGEVEQFSSSFKSNSKSNINLRTSKKLLGLLCGPLSCGHAPKADQNLLKNLVSLILKFFEGKRHLEQPLDAEFFKEIRVNF